VDPVSESVLPNFVTMSRLASWVRLIGGRP
jgi:hypothetical protein